MFGVVEVLVQLVGNQRRGDVNHSGGALRAVRINLRRGMRLAVLVIISLGFIIPLSDAQSPDRAAEQGQDEMEEGPPLQERLRAVVESVSLLETTIKDKTKELRGGQALGKEEEARAELKGLRDQRDTLKETFSELVSQTDPSGLEESAEQQELDLDKELRALLGPLIKELKELTRRPREIERIRSDIVRGQLRLSRIDKAIENIGISRAQLTDKEVLDKIDEVAASWEAQKRATSTDIEINRQRLQQKEAEKISLSAALAELFGLFFRSRGRNLLVALTAAVLFWVLALEVWRRSMRLSFFARRQASMPMRFLNLVAMGGVGMGSLIMFAVVLYFFGDWVLLILTIALLVGIVWTSKQAFARFWAQLSLLMNVGSVREGEVVVIDQLPWIVQRLNLHSQLINPRLSGGFVRVPLNHLLSLRSRPLNPREKLFPTKEGDWVILADDVLGRIALQTPEVVRVDLMGGAYKNYPTPSFLSLHPRVLSRGFRLSEIFGLDYRHQKQLMVEMVPKLREFIEEKLRNLGFGEDLVQVSVEVHSAASSSLELIVLCDCPGELAEHYDKLKRSIRRFFIEACNTFNWTIPFAQMMLHLAPPRSEG